MYDKVQKYWKGLYWLASKDNWQAVTEMDRSNCAKINSFMEETDMAVVISQAQNEVEDLRKKDWISSFIETHVAEDFDTKFKNPMILSPCLCLCHVDDRL